MSVDLRLWFDKMQIWFDAIPNKVRSSTNMDGSDKS